MKKRQRPKLGAILAILFVLIISSCAREKMFVELGNGTIRAPDGTEYIYFANEEFSEVSIEMYGDGTFLGKIKFEKEELDHLGLSIKTGMYSCDDKNMDILYRISPNSEWRAYYRKASLPELGYK